MIEVLRTLQLRRAFDPVQLEELRGQLHVPFDELTGRLEYERTLSAAAARGERIALVGRSGSGKSSITQYILEGDLGSIAPILVRVGLEPPEVACDPALFARHVVKTVAKYLDAYGTKSDAEHGQTAVAATKDVVTKRPLTVQIGGGVGWMNANLSMQLGALVGEDPKSGQDVLEQACAVLGVIRSENWWPVLVLDDTDHWLQMPTADEHDELMRAFFGPVLRMVVEQLPTGVIVAVHEKYLEHDAYLEAEPFFGTRIVLPSVPDVAGLAKVLQRRISASVPDTAVAIDEVIEPEGLQHLFDRYVSRGHNLREPLVVAHEALSKAVDSNADTITNRHVAAARADWASP